VTLRAGTSYNLVISAPSDTSYSVFTIREGSAYDYSPVTYFADGRAQYNDGSGWTAFDPGWRGPLDQSDLQMVFN